VTINQQKSVAELNAIIAKLTAELESLRRYAARLEKDLLLRDPKYDLNKVREEVLALFFFVMSYHNKSISQCLEEFNYLK
jgi:hypothetical protein